MSTRPEGSGAEVARARLLGHGFVEWLAGPAPSSGAAHAARFVLTVWNPSTDWREVGLELGDDERLGRFDLVSAIAVWDDEHRAACVR